MINMATSRNKGKSNYKRIVATVPIDTYNKLMKYHVLSYMRALKEEDRIIRHTIKDTVTEALDYFLDAKMKELKPYEEGE